jgi:hypothetical protein
MSIVKLAASRASMSRFMDILEKNAPKKLHKLIDKASSTSAVGDLVKKHVDIPTRSRISRILNKHILSDHTANAFKNDAINSGQYEKIHFFKNVRKDVHDFDNHMMANAGEDWEKHLARKK